MKKLKNILGKISPGGLQALISIKFFIKCRRMFGPIQKRVAALLFPDGEIKILTGPFEGLRSYNKIVWGTMTAKWLGCYEAQLIPVIEEIIATRYPVVVDVGAAEGFYAVGLASKMPASKLVTFDIDPIGRHRQRQLVKLNGLQNVEVRGLCSPETFAEFPAEKTVLICDIEGFELMLLDPQASPNLKNMDILVEIHRLEGASVSFIRETIVERFAGTHRISELRHVPRDIDLLKSRIPELSQLSREELDQALDEGRDYEQVWLWMKTAASPAQA